LNEDKDKSRVQHTLPIMPEILHIVQAACLRAKGPMAKLWKVPDLDTLYADLNKASITRVDAEGKKVDFHTLRYTFGYLLAEHYPIQVVKTLMRHSKITLTADLYGQLGINDLMEAIWDLPEKLGPALGPAKVQTA